MENLAHRWIARRTQSNAVQRTRFILFEKQVQKFFLQISTWLRSRSLHRAGCNSQDFDDGLIWRKNFYTFNGFSNKIKRVCCTAFDCVRRAMHQCAKFSINYSSIQKISGKKFYCQMKGFILQIFSILMVYFFSLQKLKVLLVMKSLLWK